MTTTTLQLACPTFRAIYHCRCGHRWANEADTKAEARRSMSCPNMLESSVYLGPRINDEVPPKPWFIQCRRLVYGRLVTGKSSQTPCSQKCRNSHTTYCECSCAGRNHGRGLLMNEGARQTELATERAGERP